jgi:uncharacterized protein YdeI (YjbR/CyaY-like superfamily)
MTRDSRVDEYIETAAPFAQPILTHVRALIHRALPEVEEGIKWGMPHFMVGGKNVVGLAAFKAHAAVVMHYEERTNEGMGSLGKLSSLADLPGDDELIARIKAGCSAKSAPRPRPAPKAEPSVPDDLRAALNAAPAALAVFDAFAPSHRREYIAWVTEAKREETRIRRITQTIEWLTEGRKRNWKYENC